jgi:hypothetical protein
MKFVEINRLAVREMEKTGTPLAFLLFNKKKNLKEVEQVREKREAAGEDERGQ